LIKELHPTPAGRQIYWLGGSFTFLAAVILFTGRSSASVLTSSVMLSWVGGVGSAGALRAFHKEQWKESWKKTSGNFQLTDKRADTIRGMQITLKNSLK